MLRLSTVAIVAVLLLIFAAGVLALRNTSSAWVRWAKARMPTRRPTSEEIVAESKPTEQPQLEQDTSQESATQSAEEASQLVEMADRLDVIMDALYSSSDATVSREKLIALGKGESVPDIKAPPQMQPTQPANRKIESPLQPPKAPPPQPHKLAKADNHPTPDKKSVPVKSVAPSSPVTPATSKMPKLASETVNPPSSTPSPSAKPAEDPLVSTHGDWRLGVPITV